jgi:hypothetical protein
MDTYKISTCKVTRKFKFIPVAQSVNILEFVRVQKSCCILTSLRNAKSKSFRPIFGWNISLKQSCSIRLHSIFHRDWRRCYMALLILLTDLSGWKSWGIGRIPIQCKHTLARILKLPTSRNIYFLPFGRSSQSPNALLCAIVDAWRDNHVLTYYTNIYFHYKELRTSFLKQNILSVFHSVVRSLVVV